MKSILSVVFAAVAMTSVAALPTLLNNVSLSESGCTETIAYTLETAPAIVTLELESDGEPLSPAYLTSVAGDVNRVIVTPGRHTITWRPRKVPELKDRKLGNCRAKVTAWPLDRPPDYMVVDMAAESSDRIRYYATTNDLPGGLFANEDYRKNKLVMRLIRAKGVEWMMGNLGETTIYKSGGVPSYRDASEAPHMVTLTNDYWLGVFEVTQSQWPLMGSGFFYNPSTFKVDGAMRPVENVSYSWIRHYLNDTAADKSAHYYPAPPSTDSWLGKLRTRTGLKFDLPSEAQWEFACRAGTGEGEFNNGFRCNNMYGYDDESADETYHTGTGVFPGRIQVNGGGTNQKPSTVGPTNATAIVGSYEPNRWGLYDMHGNVAEYCLDWYAVDITGLKGAVNANGANYADGTTPAEASRVARGGFWWTYATSCRSSSRKNTYGIVKCPEYGVVGKNWGSARGFRVACELQTAADFE